MARTEVYDNIAWYKIVENDRYVQAYDPETGELLYDDNGAPVWYSDTNANGETIYPTTVRLYPSKEAAKAAGWNVEGKWEWAAEAKDSDDTENGKGICENNQQINWVLICADPRSLEDFSYNEDNYNAAMKKSVNIPRFAFKNSTIDTVIYQKAQMITHNNGEKIDKPSLIKGQDNEPVLGILDDYCFECGVVNFIYSSQQDTGYLAFLHKTFYENKKLKNFVLNVPQVEHVYFGTEILDKKNHGSVEMTNMFINVKKKIETYKDQTSFYFSRTQHLHCFLKEYDNQGYGYLFGLENPEGANVADYHTNYLEKNLFKSGARVLLLVCDAPKQKETIVWDDTGIYITGISLGIGDDDAICGAFVLNFGDIDSNDNIDPSYFSNNYGTIQIKSNFHIDTSKMADSDSRNIDKVFFTFLVSSTNDLIENNRTNFEKGLVNFWLGNNIQVEDYDQDYSFFVCDKGFSFKLVSSAKEAKNAQDFLQQKIFNAQDFASLDFKEDYLIENIDIRYKKWLNFISQEKNETIITVGNDIKQTVFKIAPYSFMNWCIHSIEDIGFTHKYRYSLVFNLINNISEVVIGKEAFRGFQSCKVNKQPRYFYADEKIYFNTISLTNNPKFVIDYYAFYNTQMNSIVLGTPYKDFEEQELTGQAQAPRSVSFGYDSPEGWIYIGGRDSTIGIGAFERDDSFQQHAPADACLWIDKGVISINQFAFKNCKDIRRFLYDGINLENSFNKGHGTSNENGNWIFECLGHNSRYGCEIYIGPDVERIPTSFMYPTKLDEHVMEHEYYPRVISISTYEVDEQIKTEVINKSVKTIGTAAFKYINRSQNIESSNDHDYWLRQMKFMQKFEALETLESSAFAGVESFTHLRMSPNLKSIGENCFRDNGTIDGLTYLSRKLEYVHPNAFGDTDDDAGGEHHTSLFTRCTADGKTIGHNKDYPYIYLFSTEPEKYYWHFRTVPGKLATVIGKPGVVGGVQFHDNVVGFCDEAFKDLVFHDTPVISFSKQVSYLGKRLFYNASMWSTSIDLGLIQGLTKITAEQFYAKRVDNFIIPKTITVIEKDGLPQDVEHITIVVNNGETFSDAIKAWVEMDRQGIADNREQALKFLCHNKDHEYGRGWSLQKGELNTDGTDYTVSTFSKDYLFNINGTDEEDDSNTIVNIKDVTKITSGAFLNYNYFTIYPATEDYKNLLGIHINLQNIQSIGAYSFGGLGFQLNNNTSNLKTSFKCYNTEGANNKGFSKNAFFTYKDIEELKQVYEHGSEVGFTFEKISLPRQALSTSQGWFGDYGSLYTMPNLTEYCIMEDYSTEEIVCPFKLPLSQITKIALPYIGTTREDEETIFLNSPFFNNKLQDQTFSKNLEEITIFNAKNISKKCFSNIIPEEEDQPNQAITIDFINGLEVIREEAFDTCLRLRKISLPISLKTIEKNAFASCAFLDKVYYSGTPKDWYQINFNGLYASPFCHSQNTIEDTDPIHTFMQFKDDSIQSELESFEVPYNENDVCIQYNPYPFYGFPIKQLIFNKPLAKNTTIENIDERILEGKKLKALKSIEFKELSESYPLYDNIYKKDEEGSEYKYEALKEIILNNTITILPKNCFKNLNVDKIIINDDNITEIHENAFQNCGAMLEGGVGQQLFTNLNYVNNCGLLNNHQNVKQFEDTNYYVFDNGQDNFLVAIKQNTTDIDLTILTKLSVINLGLISTTGNQEINITTNWIGHSDDLTTMKSPYNQLKYWFNDYKAKINKLYIKNINSITLTSLSGLPVFEKCLLKELVLETPELKVQTPNAKHFDNEQTEIDITLSAQIIPFGLFTKNVENSTFSINNLILNLNKKENGTLTQIKEKSLSVNYINNLYINEHIETNNIDYIDIIIEDNAFDEELIINNIYYNKQLYNWVSTIQFKGKNANPMRFAKRFYEAIPYEDDYIYRKPLTLRLLYYKIINKTMCYILNDYSLYGNYWTNSIYYPFTKSATSSQVSIIDIVSEKAPKEPLTNGWGLIEIYNGTNNIDGLSQYLEIFLQPNKLLSSKQQQTITVSTIQEEE